MALDAQLHFGLMCERPRDAHAETNSRVDVEIGRQAHAFVVNRKSSHIGVARSQSNPDLTAP
jgi:hypothetical protein